MIDKPGTGGHKGGDKPVPYDTRHIVTDDWQVEAGTGSGTSRRTVMAIEPVSGRTFVAGNITVTVPGPPSTPGAAPATLQWLSEASGHMIWALRDQRTDSEFATTAQLIREPL